MIIDIEETQINHLIFHKISANDKSSIVNNHSYEFEIGEELHVLKTIFLKRFQESIYSYEFRHDVDVNLNVLFTLLRAIYNNEDFVEKTKDIFTHLKSVSRHPNIKDGELFVIKYEDVKYNGTYYEAVGIYKIENKENFIEPINDASGTSHLKFSKGVSNKKLAKACLILFTEIPYTVFVLENADKETDYWCKDFLNLRLKKDSINDTGNFLACTRDFIVKELPEQFEVSKADQVELLNKSVQFFKEKENFNIEEFTDEVIAQPELVETFTKYKEEYQKKHEVEIADNFTISESAVKKQSRAFKSVIKLDKNFHIYVHGNNQYIKRGYDEKTGMYYYQLFFKEEE